MIIDREACNGCRRCVPYCPMGAIIWHAKDREKGTKPYAEVNLDECVECNVCLRARVCPTEAIREQEMGWPRILRRAFSDPLYVHEGTDVPGRGTEEMKTNDVTGRFQDGFVGVGLEFGRPGTGTRLGETQKAIKKLLAIGAQLEPLNPLTQLIENKETGELRKDVVDEKVLSAIVECIVPIGKAQGVFAAVRDIAKEVNTVFSLDLICKVAPDGSVPIVEEIEKAGLWRSINGKVCVGLGRPLFKG